MSDYDDLEFNFTPEELDAIPYLNAISSRPPSPSPAPSSSTNRPAALPPVSRAPHAPATITSTASSSTASGSSLQRLPPPLSQHILQANISASTSMNSPSVAPQINRTQAARGVPLLYRPQQPPLSSGMPSSSQNGVTSRANSGPAGPSSTRGASSSSSVPNRLPQTPEQKEQARRRRLAMLEASLITPTSAPYPQGQSSKSRSRDTKRVRTVSDEKPKAHRRYKQKGSQKVEREDCPTSASAYSAMKASLQEYEDNLSCSICSDYFVSPRSVVSCGHTFCAPCLQTWIETAGQRSKPTCPNCRSPYKSTIPNFVAENLVDSHLKLLASFGSEGWRTDPPNDSNWKAYQERVREWKAIETKTSVRKASGLRTVQSTLNVVGRPSAGPPAISIPVVWIQSDSEGSSDWSGSDLEGSLEEDSEDSD